MRYITRCLHCDAPPDASHRVTPVCGARNGHNTARRTRGVAVPTAPAYGQFMAWKGGKGGEFELFYPYGNYCYLPSYANHYYRLSPLSIRPLFGTKTLGNTPLHIHNTTFNHAPQTHFKTYSKTIYSSTNVYFIQQ